MLQKTVSSILFLPFALACGAAADDERHPIPVEGFEQLLPRGAIAALVDPEFVAAEEAEIPDEAWILGFEHQGRAFAYDLNLLNSHEVVNHTIGGDAVAAVW